MQFNESQMHKSCSMGNDCKTTLEATRGSLLRINFHETICSQKKNDIVLLLPNFFINLFSNVSLWSRMTITDHKG